MQAESKVLGTAGKNLASAKGGPKQKKIGKQLLVGGGAIGLGALKSGKFLAVIGKPLIASLKVIKSFGIVSKYITTFLTMGLSVWYYAIFFGWKFAAGFVGSIFVHELGHVVAARTRGIPVSAPIFIPGFGAMILHKTSARSRWDDAIIGAGGPLAGCVFGIACLIGFVVTKEIYWLALADVTATINLFNLIPVMPLDGGWITRVISPWLWLIGMVAVGTMFFTGFISNPLLLILLIASFPQAYRDLRDKNRRQVTDVSSGQRIFMALAYIAIIAMLGLTANFAYHSLVDFRSQLKIHDISWSKSSLWDRIGLNLPYILIAIFFLGLKIRQTILLRKFRKESSSVITAALTALPKNPNSPLLTELRAAEGPLFGLRCALVNSLPWMLLIALMLNPKAALPGVSRGMLIFATLVIIVAKSAERKHWLKKLVNYSYQDKFSENWASYLSKARWGQPFPAPGGVTFLISGGYYKEAIAHIEDKAKRQKLSPMDARALGLAATGLGKPALGESLLTLSEKLLPANWPSKYMKAETLLEQRKIGDELSAIMEEAIRMAESSHANGRVLVSGIKAWWEAARFDFESSKASIERCFQELPAESKHVEQAVYYYQARALELEKQYALALQSIDRCLKLNPTGSFTHRGREARGVIQQLLRESESGGR